jgi:hypothetical protein
MRKIFTTISAALSVAISAATSNPSSADLLGSCLKFSQLSFYDFRDLQNTLQDHSFSAENGETYSINFCSHTVGLCGASQSAISSYKTDASGACVPLTNAAIPDYKSIEN